MDKYCKECGKAIDESINFCKHCGHKLDDASEENRNTIKKQPRAYTKKQKIMFSAAAALFVILIGAYLWGKSYYSPEKTVERFIAAIMENDYEKVQDLTTMQDKSITHAEAKALIALAKEEAYYINIEKTNLEEFSYQNDLMELTENGKKLLIFPRYQFSLVPQYAALNLPFEGIENTFNEETVTAKKSDEGNIVYGPMAPGKYNLHSSYSGEFTEAESDDVIILGDSYSDTVYHDVQLDAAFAAFDLYNSNDSPIKNAYIKVDEEQIAFDENLYIDSFGPLNLDGSVTITPVIETEWGIVTLEDIKIKEAYYELTLNTINKELMDNLSEVILLYGEEYVQAHAANDTAKFTTITDDLQQTFKDNFAYYIDSKTYFTGQLDKIEINEEDLTFYNKNEVAIPANFYFTASTYYSDDQPELEERIDSVMLYMVFDSDEEKWLVNEASTYGFSNSEAFNAAKTLEGSQELHNTAKVDSTSGDKDLDDEIEETTLNYIYKLVDAINAEDYELVRPYIKDDSPLHGMQADLVDRLSGDGVKQEVVHASVTAIEEDGDTWKVTTNETIKIYGDKEKTNDYTWHYTVEPDGDGIALTNIE